MMLSRLKCLSRSHSASSLTSISVWSPAINHGTRDPQQQKVAMDGGILSETDQNVLRCYRRIVKTDNEPVRNDHRLTLANNNHQGVVEVSNLKNGMGRSAGRANSAFTTETGRGVQNCRSFSLKGTVSPVNYNSPLLKGLNNKQNTFSLKLDHMNNQVRTKSSWPFKNSLIGMLSRNPVKDEVGELAEELAAVNSSDTASEAHRKVKRIPLGTLLMGGTSPQHLLDLILPYMERDEIDLNDYLVALEQLQILVYEDIIKKSSVMLRNQIPIVYLRLQLNGTNDTDFQSINNHPTFIEMCRNFKKYVPSMTSQETITCLFGMTFLNVSIESPLMISLYENLQKMPDDNLSLFDISMLFQAVRAYIRPDIMTAVHVVPKLKCFFDANKPIPNDKKTFGHLLFLLNEQKRLQLSNDARIHAVEEMYRICKETKFMEDAFIATSFLHSMYLQLYVFPLYKGQESFPSSVLNKIETLSEMAFDYLHQNIDSLSASDLSRFWKEVKFFEAGPDVKHRVQQRAVDLILSKQLKAEEITHIGEIISKNLQLSKDTLAEVTQEIQSKLKNMTHTLLLHVLKHWTDEMINMHGIKSLIQQNIVRHAPKIFEYYTSSNVTFSFMLSRQCGRLSGKLEADFQQIIHERSDSAMKYSLGMRHHINVFMYLMGQEWLSPPCVQILADLAPKVLPRMSLTQIGKVCGDLCYIHSKQKHMEKKLYMNNYENYRAAILCVLINTTRVGFHQYLSSDFPTKESMLKSIYQLLIHEYNDPLLLEVLMEQVLHVSKTLGTLKDFYLICILMSRVHYYQKDIMDNIMAFAVKNKSEIGRNYFLWFTRMLSNVCTQEDIVNVELVEFMRDFAETNFELYPLKHQLELLVYCNKLGVQSDSLMKRVFNLEYLRNVDKVTKSDADVARNAKNAIYILNRDACIDYPHLNIPWFQQNNARNMQAFLTFTRENPLKDLSRIITSAVGGSQYVGVNVPVEYGYILWRAVLMDKNNKVVEFRNDNFKYAEELGLKRYCIWYQDASDPTGWFMNFSSRLSGKKYHQIRQLEKMGYNCVLIYDTDWYSIGLTEPEDKMEFLRMKLVTNQKGCLQTPTVLSEESISVGVGHMLPVDGDTVRVAPSQIQI